MSIDDRRAWHYRAAGRTQGPHTWEELCEFRSAGRIPADVRVSDDGESFIPMSDLDPDVDAPPETASEPLLGAPATATTVAQREPADDPVLRTGERRRRIGPLGILFLVTFLVMVVAGILQMRESASSSAGEDASADQGNGVTEGEPARPLPEDATSKLPTATDEPTRDPSANSLDPAAAMCWKTAVQAVRERMIRPDEAVFPEFGAEGTSVSIAANGCTVRGYVDGVSESGKKSRVRWKSTLTELLDFWVATKTEVLE